MNPARVLVVTGIVALLSIPAGADERKFTYSTEPKTLPKGGLEFEQWATLRTGKEDGDFVRVDLREEIEYGITDRLTTAFYVNLEYLDSEGVTGVEDETEFEFEGVSSEWKYRLTDPTAAVGLLLYGEVGVGEHEQEVEFKLVAGKDVGDWTFAYNFITELEREEEEEPTGETEWEKESEIAHSFGVSYRVAAGVNIGVEGLARLLMEGTFKETESHAYFIGPNVHVASKAWWATLTFLKQVDIKENSGLDLERLEKYELRLIFGLNF